MPEPPQSPPAFGQGSFRRANQLQLRDQGRFFEIWFAVLFDENARRALWIRYDLLKSPSSDGHAIVWAALSDSQATPKVLALKRVQPLSALQRQPGELAWGTDGSLGENRWRGALRTAAGAIAWDLHWLGQETPLPPREPAGLGALPLPTRVRHVRDRASFVADVELNGEHLHLQGQGVQKHIWGTRRVERLFWLYCPAWQDEEGALEATSVRLRASHPAMCAVAGAVDGRKLTGHHVPQMLHNRLRVGPGDRLEFEATGLLHKIIARASCQHDTLIGYIYRDPSGVDIPVAQSDLGACDVDVFRRRASGLAWRRVHQLHASHAALEFHGMRLPGVRYLEWTEEC